MRSAAPHCACLCFGAGDAGAASSQSSDTSAPGTRAGGRAASERENAARRDTEGRLPEIARGCARVVQARRRVENRPRKERSLRALHRIAQEDRRNREARQENSRPAEALLCYAEAFSPWLPPAKKPN